jgi:hypothetical protein
MAIGAGRKTAGHIAPSIEERSLGQPAGRRSRIVQAGVIGSNGLPLRRGETRRDPAHLHMATSTVGVGLELSS